MAMPEEKKKGLGLIIAMGKPKMGDDAEMPMDKEPEEESGAFDGAAGECYAALKADDPQGFAEALRLAIEAMKG